MNWKTENETTRLRVVFSMLFHKSLSNFSLTHKKEIHWEDWENSIFFTKIEGRRRITWRQGNESLDQRFSEVKGKGKVSKTKKVLLSLIKCKL